MDKIRWILYLAIGISVANIVSGFENIDVILAKSAVFRQFEKRLADLEERDEQQQSLIVKLTNELDDQKDENTVLRETVAKLKSKLDHPNTTRDNYKETPSPRPGRTVLEHAKQRQLRHSTHPNEVKSRHSRGISKRQQTNQADVAFSTGLSRTIPHAGQNQNIVFDKVTTNIANGYNAHHGVFIAPVAGTYVFYSSIMAQIDREVHCRFVLNGAHSATIWARGSDGRYDQGSNMIIVQLNKGDDVSVQNVISDDAIYGDAGLYTTFSGFLLQGMGELNIMG